MSWEQRLREMILAGGALAATACGGSTSAQADAASSTTTNPGDDATASGDDDGQSSPPPQNFCCNASSDPCCYLGCEPDAGITPACAQEQECESDGGSIDSFGKCVIPSEAGSPDAETRDGGPTDADVPEVEPGLFCCNANPDPCCPIAYCAGGVGPDGGRYVTCEQNRTQCEAMDGSYYTHQPDGSLGCTPPSTTGH